MIALWLACGGPVDDTGPVLFDVLDPFHTLVVTTATGSVALLPSEDGDLHGELVIVDRADGYKQELSDGVLTLAATCPNGEAGCTSGFALEVADDLKIEVETEGGDLSFEDVRDAEIRATTSSGDLRTVRLGRNVDLDVTTAGGAMDVHFQRVPNGIDLQTDLGDIDVTVPSDGYNYEIIAGGEDVVRDVLLDPDGPSVRLTSSQGDVALTGQLE